MKSTLAKNSNDEVQSVVDRRNSDINCSGGR